MSSSTSKLDSNAGFEQQNTTWAQVAWTAMYQTFAKRVAKNSMTVIIHLG